MKPAVRPLPISVLGQWSAASGSAKLVRVGEDVALITVSGHFEAAIAEPLVSALCKAMEEDPPAAIFFDLEFMERHDRRARTILTKALRGYDVYTFGASTRVRMGISLANLRLGGRIRGIKSRADFEALLREVARIDRAGRIRPRRQPVAS